MTTRIYLVRHGSTALTAENRFTGVTDAGLSEQGRRQVSHLARRLAEHDISAIYCSPMLRTVQTAAIISEAHRLTPIVRAELRELDYGRWEAMSHSEVEAQYPEEYAAWQEDPFTLAPAGGEPGVTLLARALPAIREIVVSHPGQTVAVVSHKATIRLVLCNLLGIDARGYRERLDLLPASLNVVDFRTPTRARLMLLNDVSHYAGRPSDSRPGNAGSSEVV